jgi:IS1 family transposase
MLDRSSIVGGVNRLSFEERTRVVSALVEGNSVRAACRMTGAAKGTILRLLGQIGQVCAEYQDKILRKLTCRRIQCDEIWTFCYAKEKNVPDQYKGEFGYGDVWTWVALDADSKLIVCWYLGRRDADDANRFIASLAERLAHKIKLTTDGHKAYLDAVEGAFGGNVDYAQLVKLYGAPTKEEQRRYSPAQCIGAEVAVIEGNPDPQQISTSYVERQNLTMRMHMRRFTRLTNGFSKKAENLEHALALHFMYYNFCRVHKTVKMTPAMAAGVEDHAGTVGEIVGLLEPN